MATTHAFEGRVLSSSLCELGEGPSFESETETLWWFDILGKGLHELHLPTGREIVHALPVMASALASIDAARQMIASDKGMFIRDRATGALSPYLELEPEKPGNRSNDGRVHPSGSLWIGTMGRKAEDGAGAIYHVRQGEVTKLFDRISIPNSICFSPDGAIGYYTDTRVNRLMRVSLDPATGLPNGEAEFLVDENGRPGGIDGSICASDGTIWNARWGEGAIDHYSADGQHLSRHLVPAKQTTCPAFIGKDRLAVTSAREGLDEAARTADPFAGSLFEIAVSIQCDPEPAYRL
ncbi:SMP-30/gluconolactonase/LRE family protein [Neorhizobium galegae]|uniref:SMP-30/gluconolactonase/LRE family protein n=1 Tax=Neorhizobium galegae TaxID=399 RepID=UPI00210354E2|nr:SMP-30/gluconolactonase/LRE family protein [Neorhizobium galegae]MCQ1834206.1 SMP-30/gluconolactonase/LRE family protein [Neorhizobium galegae]